MSIISDRLKAFNEGRLPEMLALKYEAMTEDAFRFFRGTCHIFYEDLASAKDFPESPLAWICGDLHLENFGSYKANNKLVYFDLNDFDEAILAPCLWEAVRLVTSIFVAFDVLGMKKKKAENMATLFLKDYSSTLRSGKAVSIDPRTAKGIVCHFLEQAAEATHPEIVAKRTESKKKKIYLSLSDERHFRLKKKLRKALMEHIEGWIRNSNESPYNYKIKDVVFRLAGTGSIGVKRYLFLLKSTNDKGSQYLLLDMKQSFPSSLAPFTLSKQPLWKSDAERITQIQQRMQNMSASMLGTTVFEGAPYVIQELQPVKDTIEFKLIRDQYRDIYQVIGDMAILTASSQLRSGGMGGSSTIDGLIAFGSSDGWQDSVLQYALAYAAKVKKQYFQFVKDHKKKVFLAKKL